MSNKVSDFIASLGGIRVASRAIGVSIGSVQYWIKSNKFPKWRVDAIKAVASANNIDITNYFNGGKTL